MRENDKSALIGALLIGVLIFSYPYFFPETEKDMPSSGEETTMKKTKGDLYVDTLSFKNQDRLIEEHDTTKESLESILKEQTFLLENDNIKLSFSNDRGEISSAIIKGYYSYSEYKKNLDDNSYQKKDIEIFNNSASKFIILAKTNDGRTVSTDGIFDECEIVKSNSLTLRKNFNSNTFIEYQYTLNTNKKNILEFSINTSGISDLELVWTIAAPQTEKSKITQEHYTGFYYQEDYSKDIDYTFTNNDEFEINEFETELKWIAFTQQFFSTIIKAKDNFSNDTKFKVTTNEDEYIKTLSLKSKLKNTKNEYEIYFGPNDYNQLKSYNEGYEEIIDMGWGIFGWVNKYVVIKIFDVLKNTAGIASFGLIILLLTIIIKLALSPLTYKSYLSQAKMKVLKPEVDKINEKHKSKDPMKAQKETMGLYRKAGVNPLGGCLPMLLQFPILIAMFKFFPVCLDLRQNSFLWADDLSAYDSIYELGFHIPFYGDHVSLFTLLMTISTLMYTHMNTQMSGNQMPGMKWMMYLMPIMFLGFLNSYASSLSYYYFLANIFTFTQMYFMRRFIDEKTILAQLEANKKKPPKPKSKFQKKLEEIQKKQEQQMKNKRKK